MKIGLVCPYNMIKGGGVQEYVSALQRGFIAAGDEAIILTPRPKGAFTEQKGVVYLGLARDVKTPLGTTAQFSVSVDQLELDAVLEREQFDILHFHEPWVPILSRQIARRSGAVQFATFHAKLPDTLMAKTMTKVITPYTRSVLKYFDVLTAVSDAAAEYVTSQTSRDVNIIPNGIDLAKFTPPRKAPVNPLKTIVYVGRLEHRKGVSYLLRAFAQLQKRHPDVKLVIAGDGVQRKQLEHLAYQKLALENVEFLGYISEETKRTLLQTADLFCAPALYGESFGIVLLEAMASGLVTVAGNNPGYASVMKGLGSISLINPKQVLAFADKLELLIYEQELRDVWLEWAKKEVVQYDYSAIIKRYKTLYNQAIEDKRSADA